MNALREELTQAIKEKPLLFEGAYDRNLGQFQDLLTAAQQYPTFDGMLSVSHPELIRRMHQDYVAAGCDVLQTFTWGLHPTAFDEPVEHEEIAQAAQRAAEIACEVARDASSSGRLWVAGIVPSGIHPLPMEKTTPLAVQSAARLIAGALIEGGVDLLVVALPLSIADASIAVDGVIEACDSTKVHPPLLVSFDLGPQGLLFGDDLGQALATCESMAFSVGVYLTTHPERLPDAPFDPRDRRSRAHVFSDAGYAQNFDGEIRYSLEPPEYGRIVAAQARRLGLSFIGGGWGVSPRHIHELRRAVDAGSS